jgi:hypothetical protein
MPLKGIWEELAALQVAFSCSVPGSSEFPRGSKGLQASSFKHCYRQKFPRLGIITIQIENVCPDPQNLEDVQTSNYTPDP